MEGRSFGSATSGALVSNLELKQRRGLLLACTEDGGKWAVLHALGTVWVENGGLWQYLMVICRMVPNSTISP